MVMESRNFVFPQKVREKSGIKKKADCHEHDANVLLFLLIKRSENCPWQSEKCQL